MNLVRDASKDAAVRIANTPEGLSSLRNPDCAAAIWQRNPPQGVEQWLDTLAKDRLPKARSILRPDAVHKALVQICETSGTPNCAERDRFIEDVAALSNRFAGLMNAKWLRLRLDVVETNACRRFHIDAVTARLVCTYRGTGTQYGFSLEGADPDHITTVATGMPVLLRGTLWPTQPDSGLLHRSPPIEGSGETRLLLVLDPIENPENEPDHLFAH
ncbi:hypothetical protein RA28_09030 [Ruegeria sp. ANG-S4]|uniref:DUF1826 domain-containing protein n=1 Tax=Ruegeria sp. ANG-S4 TaxID=1577904 RepID=UPI00057C40B4|nr:DUF1826 domain-containing protein [Ruegeria sp. ANG-S4]KIC45818.1 hypothetical protein RA28_09030 [Ruegeria sp. ANG-S4]